MLIGVLGLRCGGLPVVSGVLSRLGVNMGDKLMMGDRWIRGGYYVFERLDNALSNYMPLPYIRPARSDAWLDRHFDRVLRKHIDEYDGEAYGIAHPNLITLAKRIEQVYMDQFRWVRVTRDIEEAVLALHHRERVWYNREYVECSQPQRELNRQIEVFTSIRPHVEIGYEEIMGDPEAAVERLRDELGLDPSEEKVEEAVSFVNETPGASVYARV